MIEQDYIMRIIQQFFEFLNRLLGSNQNLTTEEVRMQLQDMYVTYFDKKYDFFHNATPEELIRFINNESAYPFEQGIEMLAELLFSEGMHTTEKMQKELLNKSLVLYNYLEEKTKVFSIERIEKKQRILEIINSK